MATPRSDNGWIVVRPEATHTRKTVYPKGSGVPFVVRNGTQPLFQALVDFLDSIEPVELEGWDGGYSYRQTRGSDTAWSCHASATAIDWNASRHPRGKRNTFTWNQRRKIRAFLKTPVGRAFKWGADFSTVPDDMHFQLRDPATVRDALNALRSTSPRPPATRPVQPPKEEPDMFRFYYTTIGPNAGRLYDISTGHLRYVSGTEASSIRKQGGKIISIEVAPTDAIWTLPFLSK